MPLPHSPAAYQRGRLAYQRSQKAMPLRWYESLWVSYLVFIPLMFVLSVVTLSQYQFSPPLWLSLLSMAAYSLSWWVDTLTTHRSMALGPAFERRGIACPSYETNPLTRETPHLLLQLLSPSTLLALLVVALSWFVPAVGLSFGVIHVLAGIANQRHTQRMRQSLRYFDENGMGEEWPPPDKENGRETHSEMLLLAGPFRLDASLH